MKIHSLLVLGLILTLPGCAGMNPFHTDVPVVPKPSTIYADSSTPKGMRVEWRPLGQDEYNGGLIDEVTIDGHDYDVVTPNLAVRVKRWESDNAAKSAAQTEEGRYDGIIAAYAYQGHTTSGVPKIYILTAIDVDVMRQYDFH